MYEGTITLRAPELTDLERMYAFENDASAWEYGDTVAPLSRRMLEEYILTYDADPYRSGQLRLVLDIDGVAAGLLDLYEIDRRHRHAYVAVYVSEQYRRRGVATAGLQQLCAYAHRHLQLHTLAAFILPSNTASVALFRRVGFRHCGTLPGWRSIENSFQDLDIFVLEIRD